LSSKLAGGANIGNMDKSNFFNIGIKNIVQLQKLFQNNGIKVSGEDLGGKTARNLFLQIGTGKTWIQKEKTLKVL